MHSYQQESHTLYLAIQQGWQENLVFCVLWTVKTRKYPLKVPKTCSSLSPFCLTKTNSVQMLLDASWAMSPSHLSVVVGYWLLLLTSTCSANNCDIQHVTVLNRWFKLLIAVVTNSAFNPFKVGKWRPSSVAKAKSGIPFVDKRAGGK